jgi:hypothetical protein
MCYKKIEESTEGSVRELRNEKLSFLRRIFSRSCNQGSLVRRALVAHVEAVRSTYWVVIENFLRQIGIDFESNGNANV